MPIDPVSDLPVGLSIALSSGPKSAQPFGLLPLESRLRYIGRHHHLGNAEDIWELMAGLGTEDTSWNISP